MRLSLLKLVSPLCNDSFLLRCLECCCYLFYVIVCRASLLRRGFRSRLAQQDDTAYKYRVPVLQRIQLANIKSTGTIKERADCAGAAPLGLVPAQQPIRLALS